MEKELEIILTQIGKQIEDNKEHLSKEIHGGLKGIRIHVDANSEVLEDKFDGAILRVDELEKQTSWWRYFQRNPKKTVGVMIVLIIGAFVLMGVDVDGERIMEFIKNIKFW